MSISDELLAAASDPAPRGDRPAVPVFLGGSGSRPGIDLTSNRALLEALEEGLELDSRR
ncbi:MAG: antitoxin [Actinomycetota bacterium]|nr:antitoxin [Actinomycetota bacterium]